MGGRMDMQAISTRTAWSHGEAEALLSDAAVGAIRRLPAFRPAAEAHAALALAAYEAESDASHWFASDLGRASIYGAALSLDAWPTGVTVTSLAGACAGFCSKGRVLAFVQHAQAAGWLIIPPGSETWTHRRLSLCEPFFDLARSRLRISLIAAGMIEPAIAPAAQRVDDLQALRSGCRELGRLMLMHPDLRNAVGDPRLNFLGRDAGVQILQHFLVRQPPGRADLLGDAQFCRSDLARRYSVSRAHVNKLITDAEADGLLVLTAPDRIAFSTQLSADLEAYFAGLFLVSIRIGRAMLARPGL
jgi:hypothetical protein